MLYKAALDAAMAEWSRRYPYKPWPLNSNRGGPFGPSAEEIALADTLYQACWRQAGTQEVTSESHSVQARSVAIKVMLGDPQAGNWPGDWTRMRGPDPGAEVRVALDIQKTIEWAESMPNKPPATNSDWMDHLATFSDSPTGQSFLGPASTTLTMRAKAVKAFPKMISSANERGEMWPNWDVTGGILDLARRWYGTLSPQQELANALMIRYELQRDGKDLTPKSKAWLANFIFQMKHEMFEP